MNFLIKNVFPDTELQKIQTIFPGLRAKGRGPRGRGQGAFLPLDQSTKVTMYYDEPVYRTHHKSCFAITGWKGNKPILRPLDNPSANPNQPYYIRRKANV